MGSSLHVAFFPFMAKGHTIPLLHLLKRIHNSRCEAKFTVFTTLANEPFIVSYLSSVPLELINIVSLPFPPSSDILNGVESTDQLPSISLFYPFLEVVESLQIQFEIALKNLQEQDVLITCLVSDGFLHWTQESASKFDIPRLVFYGMNNYSFVLYSIVDMTQPFAKVESKDELITFPELPCVRVTRNDFDGPWSEQVPQGPHVEYMYKCGIATFNSYGLLVNSFYELESRYVDYWNLKFQPKAWCIGPLCIAEDAKLNCFDKEPGWVSWLDKKRDENRPVLYVGFGTQAETSSEQLKEIVIGLEKSGVDFLWALRIKPNQEEVVDGLEQRVGERGVIVREWVDQKKILEHEGTRGYLSHCGWNSVTESVCARVPILAMPMMAEQHLNVRMIVEEMKVGLRVDPSNGSVRGLVKSEELSKAIHELMGGENGKMVRKNVDELAKVAKRAFHEEGSSWNNIELLLSDLIRKSSHH